MNESLSLINKAQEELLTTIHHQESVVEVYLNRKEQLITELKHLSNHRVRVYRFQLDKYIQERRGTDIAVQLTNRLEVVAD